MSEVVMGLYEILQENTSLSNYLRSSKGSQTTSECDEGDLTSSVDEDEYSDLLHDCKERAKEWGIHRFQKDSWSDTEKPCVQLKTYDDLILTEDEKLGILSDRVIGICSSYLQMLPEVHRKLRDISQLRFYHYFQYLDLSYNCLEGLSILEQLPFLTHLDASHNQICKVLDFKAPFNLTKVNLSHNKIKQIPDLSAFWSLTDLNLSHNEISLIEGLDNLRYLTNLNLGHNFITKLGNLKNLRIQHLQLHHNEINKTTQNFSIKMLCHLRHIDLSFNNLDTLWFFEDANNLEHIEISNNKIRNLMNLYYLQKLMFLTDLNLSGNPICSSQYFSFVLISVASHLRTLNGNPFELREVARGMSSVDVAINDATEQRIRLMLLQQINRPNIGDHIFPYDQPSPTVIILVGPPGSRKRELLRRCCAIYGPRLVKGVSHTTRKKNQEEVEGEDYYFIDKDEFSKMLSEGRFIACSEILGEYFGIACTELAKAVDGVLIFHSDLQVGLTLRVRSLNPKLILTLPFSEDYHLGLLIHKYCIIEDNGALFIRNCPEEARKSVDRFEESLRKKLIDDIRCIVYEIVDYICLSSESVPDSTFVVLKSSRKWSTSSKGAKTVDSYSEQVSDFIMDDDTCDMSDTDTIFYENTQINFRSKQYKSSLSNKGSASAINYFSSSNFTQEFVESLHTFFGQQMKVFFNSIKKSRNELLEIHWATPGLFREIIFTDNENESIKRLKDVLKYIVKHDRHSKPLFQNFKKQSGAKEYLEEKVAQYFKCINNELSVSEIQSERIKRQFKLQQAQICGQKDKCQACLKCFMNK